MITIHTYTATTWTNGVTNGSGGVGGTMTNIETGIANAAADLLAHQQAATLDHPNGSVLAAHMGAGAANDAAIGNRTPTDSTTAASGAQTLTAALSMLANIAKQITGGANWYTAPAITIASLAAHHSRHATGGADALTAANIGALGNAGDTSTGVITTQQTLSGANKTLARFQATDGKSYILIITTSGQIIIWNETDAVSIAEFGPTAGKITANGATVWTSTNDGAGSTLDADKLDGNDSTAFAMITPTGAKVTVAHAFPGSPAKWDVCVLTPFS